MSAPSLTIAVEPAEASSVVYGPLAPRISSDAPNGQLSLVLTITNNETSPVHLNQVAVSFSAPPAVPSSTIAADLLIPPGTARQWYFGPSNNVILPEPAPGTVTVALSCDTYSTPATWTVPLALYVSPASPGGYDFPGMQSDLQRGELWTGQSAAHGAAGGGTQLFAYDLLIRAYDPDTNSWPTAVPGSDATQNANYHIWGKPLHAMADGMVRQFMDGIAANTPPGLPSPTPNPVEGNHFYISHGPDLALYAHFQAGTLNPALTAGPGPGGTGATVTKGQLLGLSGNSGNSSEPHLHIQVNRTTVPWGGPPRPLQFNGIHVLDLSVVPQKYPPNSDAPWVTVAARSLPNVTSAIWPGPLRIGPRTIWDRIGAFTWAWIIIIGALMITPGGVSCPACGPLLTDVIGVVSILLGVLGLASRAIATRAAAARTVAPAKVSTKGNLHG